MEIIKGTHISHVRNGHGIVTEIVERWNKPAAVVIFQDGFKPEPFQFETLTKRPYEVLADLTPATDEEIAELEQRVADRIAHQAIEKASAEDASARALAATRTNPDYAHLTICERSGGVEAAKNLRKDLKKHFPGVKFSVRADYSSINVKWVDGPTRAMVEAIANRYQCGSFNGMEDIYEFSHSPFTTLFGGAQYVFCYRDLSDELEAATFERLRRRYPEAPTLEDYKRGHLWQFEAYRYTVQEALANAGHEEPEEEQDEPAEPVIEVAPVAAIEAPAPAQEKPKFTAKQVGGVWSVTIEQGEERHQFDGIEAATLAEACRLAWALLTQPTPPDDDPSGQPLPVEPLAEQANQPDQGEPGAEAPTLTRAQRLGDYRGRVEGKRERLEVRAVKANSASGHRWRAAHAAVAGIPFGQPILVGHHSERRHRRAIERADQNMRQSIELDKKAKHLASRAASVGHAGIASDDPDALQQLRAKLAEREQIQESFKAANKAKRGTVAAYRLSNNSAEIRRLRQRIEQIEQLHQAAPIEQAGHGWQMGEDEGRIVLAFDQRQPAEVVTVVKAAGFVYARSRTAWVRKVTANAVRAAERLAVRLAELLPA